MNHFKKNKSPGTDGKPFNDEHALKVIGKPIAALLIYSPIRRVFWPRVALYKGQELLKELRHITPPTGNYENDYILHEEVESTVNHLKKRNNPLTMSMY